MSVLYAPRAIQLRLRGYLGVVLPHAGYLLCATLIHLDNMSYQGKIFVL